MNPQPTTSDELAAVSIASPCTVPWTSMRGDDQKRFCKHCRLNVYNLSDMTRSQANTFLRESEGRVCVTYLKRSDGTFITRDCADARAATVRRRTMMAVGGFFLVLWQTLALVTMGNDDLARGPEFIRSNTLAGEWLPLTGLRGLAASTQVTGVMYSLY